MKKFNRCGYRFTFYHSVIRLSLTVFNLRNYYRGAAANMNTMMLLNGFNLLRLSVGWLIFTSVSGIT